MSYPVFCSLDFNLDLVPASGSCGGNISELQEKVPSSEGRFLQVETQIISNNTIVNTMKVFTV